MNGYLKSLSYDKLIFWDLEMASQHKSLQENERMLEVYRYKKRDKVTLEIPSLEETLDMYDKEAALNPIYGMIVSSSVGIVVNNAIRIISFKGDEKEIIAGTLDIFNKGKDPNKRRMIIGVNSNGFDLPYMRKRHNILGMGEYPEWLNDVGKKSWDMDKIAGDLMTLFKGSSFYTSSLDEMCMAYGVPSPKHTGVKGSEVSKAFWDGRIDDIVVYDEADVFSTINLFRKMRGEDILPLEETTK